MARLRDGSGACAAKLHQQHEPRARARAWRARQGRRAAVRGRRAGRQLGVLADLDLRVRAACKLTGPDLLKRTIFYKVGHHGSHNATLKEHGVDQMDGLKAAIIPVDEVEAKKKRWGSMPLPDLIAALEKKAPGCSFGRIRSRPIPRVTS